MEQDYNGIFLCVSCHILSQQCHFISRYYYVYYAETLSSRGISNVKSAYDIYIEINNSQHLETTYPRGLNRSSWFRYDVRLRTRPSKPRVDVNLTDGCDAFNSLTTVVVKF